MNAKPILLCSGLLLALSAGCDKRSEPESQLTQNIERSVGPGQASTGMLGGNSAPNDAGAVSDAETP